MLLILETNLKNSFPHMKTAVATAFGAVLMTLGSAASAQGQLTVYCGVQEEWCRPMVAVFEKTTGIKVSMTRKSSGEIYAQI